MLNSIFFKPRISRFFYKFQVENEHTEPNSAVKRTTRNL